MLLPLERNPRYQLLDVWRGLACLMVVLHHAGFAVLLENGSRAGGWEAWLRWATVSLLWRMNLGVALFFVISGYCIGASVDATRRRGLGSLAFLGRRIWRIYPPYWAALLGFVALIGGLNALGLERLTHGDGAHALQLDAPTALNATQWVGNLTLTEEWRPLVWHPPERRVFTRVAWSLCYEEQFYFVCFCILLIAPRRLYGALAVVTVCAVLLRVVAADIGRYSQIEGAFPTLWHEFAVGLAVYWRLNVPASVGAKRGVELGLALLAVAGAFGGLSTPVPYSTAATGLFGLALIALRGWDERAIALGWLRPLRACGKRCYSIYLVHLPVCTVGNLWLHEQGLTGFWMRVLVMIPVVSAASVAVSWLFFWGVERHFLNPPIVARDPLGKPRQTL
ncbi:Peptidoglycan/LPS O-acetylase OafA/YrhL, contains acyltransferase and SGNH-hydrolase domains [Singulisphaera sp. GP187]|uniref:acyltransferase family protein n=1 Tax=Singulisphaera sp. GP187 TaxID=1882752 RepID=UPI0009259275|nr:acyltransferase [Singulisphaera sp. GP187]SIO66120.1 Peptidoglycan/LPS O-acetylase OafA/YrhL, contains acyltransferase and SGNH-hydrolase domains [Singulisphaera sp. GP187]